MSLQVWLPLDGDLRNQGLGIVNQTSNATVSYYNDGKIGKAYNLNVRTTFTCENLNGLSSFSICFWAKTLPSSTLTTNWQDIIGFNDINLSGTVGQFRFETCYGTTGTGIHWHNNTANAIVNGSATYFTERNVWHHCVFTIEKGVAAKSYVDGILFNTYTGTSLGGGHLNGKFWIGETNNIEGALNDVRIYDHVLSIKEIKELAKGLVLHYKLNKPIFNLMPNSYSMPYGTSNPATGTWRNAGSSTMTKKRIDLGGGNYCFQNSGIQTANDGSCWGIDSFPLAANTQFTISCEARLTEGTEGYAGFCVYGSTPNGGYDKIDKNYCVTSLNNHWKVCYLVFTTNSNTTRNIYIGATTGSTNATIQIKNIKIEIGDHPTPWAPKETDPEYTILGYNSNIEPDCSGYKRDGIVTGTLTAAADTPRYRTSYYFNGSSYINAKDACRIKDAITVSCWVKPETTSGSPVSCIQGGGWGWQSKLTSYLGTDNNGSNVYVGTTSLSTATGVWMHIALTFDGTTVSNYLNGSLVSTATCPKREIHYNTNGALFIGGECNGNMNTPTSIYKGNISDVRVYCTALSADDIKALYEDAGYIDNQDNFHAYEYSEF